MAAFLTGVLATLNRSYLDNRKGSPLLYKNRPLKAGYSRGEVCPRPGKNVHDSLSPRLWGLPRLFRLTSDDGRHMFSK